MTDIPTPDNPNAFIVGALVLVLMGLMGAVTLLVKTLSEVRAVKSNGGGPDLRGINEKVTYITEHNKAHDKALLRLHEKVTTLGTQLNDHVIWEMQEKYAHEVKKTIAPSQEQTMHEVNDHAEVSDDVLAAVSNDTPVS